MLILPIIWKGLKIEDFAVIGIIEASTPFLSCVLSLSAEQYVTRFYYTWKADERLSNIAKNLTLNFLAVMVLGLAALAILFMLFSIILFDDFNYYLYGLLYIIFYSTFAFPNSLFRITNDTNGYMVFTLSLFVFRLLLNYVFTISLGLGVEGYIISNTINSLLFFLIIYGYLFVIYRFSIDYEFFKTILRFTLPFIPTNLSSNISNLADRLILNVYGGKFEAGLLTIGQKIASITGSLSQAIKLAYVPYISEFISSKKYSVNSLNKSRMLFVTPVSLLSFFLILFGVELLHLIGMDIMEANKYLYLFLLVVYLNSNNLFFAPGLYLSKRSDKMWIPNFLQLVVRCILYFLVVPSLGLEGVILVSLLASTLYFAYNYYLSEKYFKLNLNKLWIVLQFLPFAVPLSLALFKIEMFELNLFSRVLLMSFYLLLLWSFLYNRHDKHHTQIA